NLQFSQSVGEHYRARHPQHPIDEPQSNADTEQSQRDPGKPVCTGTPRSDNLRRKRAGRKDSGPKSNRLRIRTQPIYERDESPVRHSDRPAPAQTIRSFGGLHTVPFLESRSKWNWELRI